MTNQQEVNTLLQNGVAKNFAILKNSVGRPRKRSEIIFSPQPKSIISTILCDEQKELQNDSNFKSDNVNKTGTENGEKSSRKDYSDRMPYNKNDHDDQILLNKIKLHKCDYKNCNYTTKFHSNLTTHKRIHTSERPYACDECIFRTNFINSLKTHKRLHRADLPFVCKHCKYKCNSGSNLKKHCYRKHSRI